jgi:hypothetical protein
MANCETPEFKRAKKRTRKLKRQATQSSKRNKTSLGGE